MTGVGIENELTSSVPLALPVLVSPRELMALAEPVAHTLLTFIDSQTSRLHSRCPNGSRKISMLNLVAISGPATPPDGDTYWEPDRVARGGAFRLGSTSDVLETSWYSPDSPRHVVTMASVSAGWLQAIPLAMISRHATEFESRQLLPIIKQDSRSLRQISAGHGKLRQPQKAGSDGL